MRSTIPCPHCQSRTVAHSGEQVSAVQYEIRFSCTDVECGHTFLATMTAVRTTKASEKPNASVDLPLSSDIYQVDRKPEKEPKPAAKIDALTDKQKIAVIELRKTTGLSNKEIGRRYSVSRETIRRTLRNAEEEKKSAMAIDFRTMLI